MRLKQLQNRVRTLERALEGEAKLWSFCLPDGTDLTAEQRAQIGPRDRVVIRYYPFSYLDLARI